MAGAKFQYDENGSQFYYFLLAFESLVLIPCTYYFFISTGSNQRSNEKEKTCQCENCLIKASRLRSNEPWRRAKRRALKCLLLIGLVLLCFTLYKIAHVQNDTIVYDPYEILQIDQDAPMAEIKKAYRKLSLVYHPDKDSGDEEKFMMIAKAYTALTQEEARRNWEQYGNPDGPGATSFGIALPAWIVDQKNSIWVLGLYALLFMIALPIVVGCWWYRSINKQTVLFDTVKIYYSMIHKTPYMIFKRVIMIIACSLEFERTHNPEVVERPTDNILMPQLIKQLGNVHEKNREKPLCYVYSLKARALIYAHLSRLKLDYTLEEDKNVILKKCPLLIQEFVSCTSQLTMLALAGKIARMPSLDTMENAMKLSPCIVQALWNHQSSILQLPHITEDMLKHFSTRKRNIRSIWNLAQMQDDDRRAMLRSLTDEEYSNVINVVSRLPVISVQVKSEVLDDEDSCEITAGALVTVTATIIRKNMSTLFVQKEKNHKTGFVDNSELTENKESTPENVGGPSSSTNEIEKKLKVWQKPKKKKGNAKSKNATSRVNKKASNGVLPSESVHHEKVESDKDSECNSESENNGASVETEDLEDEAEWKKFQSKKERILENKSNKSMDVHCPFFPENKQECWWVYLADKRRHVLITHPYLLCSLVDEEEVELKFNAPPKPGMYTYVLIVRSDSYLEFDVMKTIHLDVKEAKEMDEAAQVQWDVSEEEEENEEESCVEDSDLETDKDSD